MVYVITGGGSGIGRALAQALAARQQRVLIVGRREPALRETAAVSHLIDYCCADVSTEEGRERIVAHLAQVDRIAGLVHNAGIMDPLISLAQMDELAWQQTLATNLNAPLFLTKMLLEKLKQGRVLHIGSGLAYIPMAGGAAYCVSKAALAMLTRCWQEESQDPAFASVMPGIVDTPMQAKGREAEYIAQDKRELYIKLQQEGRLVATTTVASFLVWLLMDVAKAKFSTQEWDIYDKSHHSYWLTTSQEVPDWQ